MLHGLLMKFLAEVAADPAREIIARAIFEATYKISWDEAKHRDQWLALGSWQVAGEVMKVLPIMVGLDWGRDDSTTAVASVDSPGSDN